MYESKTWDTSTEDHRGSEMLCQSIFIVSSTALGIGGAKHDRFYPYGKAYGQVFREQRVYSRLKELLFPSLLELTFNYSETTGPVGVSTTGPNGSVEGRGRLIELPPQERKPDQNP
jgi:hypothetical protein